MASCDVCADGDLLFVVLIITHIIYRVELIFCVLQALLQDKLILYVSFLKIVNYIDPLFGSDGSNKN